MHIPIKKEDSTFAELPGLHHPATYPWDSGLGMQACCFGLGILGLMHSRTDMDGNFGYDYSTDYAPLFRFTVDLGNTSAHHTSLSTLSWVFSSLIFAKFFSARLASTLSAENRRSISSRSRFAVSM